jgi:predicted MPP superfamily phosphohydrolase
MSEDPVAAVWMLWTLAGATWIGVPIYAAVLGRRFYATFSGVILTFALPSALILHSRLRDMTSAEWTSLLDFIFCYSMAVVGIQFTHLVRARMRSSYFRWLVSVPAQTFVAGGMLATPWLLFLLPVRLLLGYLEFFQWEVAQIGWTLLEALPLVVAGLSIITSMTARPETVRFRLSRNGPDEIQRVPVERFHGRPPEPLLERPLRIVQISDTHLGPWQSVPRLRSQIAGLVARDPDLVMLTGDFLTMESMGSPGCLEEAMQPLLPIADRCAAIFGNHDHEAPDHVRDAMAAIGIRLLIDDESCFDTPIGRVQVVGSDYINKDRREHLDELLTRFPRRPDHLRLLLLHDPLGFHSLPDDDVDLVLSGHTHGGQIGLVSLGLDWTVLSPSRWPDQGLFARGASRLYVHRGTGFYGFPLRVGVPAEHSVLEISPT